VNEIYLDSATTTRLDERVLKEMEPYFTAEYAAPSGHFGHQASMDAKEKMEEARAVIAGSINAEPSELIFTSGATESNNMALLGFIKTFKGKPHVVTSSIEHESVLNTLKALEKQARIELTLVSVDEDGFVKLDELASAMRDDTALCSIHLVNHEIGVIQPVAEIGRLCAEKGVVFHVDADNGWGRVPFDVKEFNVSLASFSAHKIHGPKGIGALYRKENIKLLPIMYGGYNEFELRPGIENVPGIMGMAKAISLIETADIQRIDKLRRMMWSEIEASIPWVKLNGSLDKTAPHLLNLTFEYIEGESILLHLDMQGIAAATGSACFSKALEASYVLLAMGRPHEMAHGSMRFSFSKFNTEDEVKHTVEVLKQVVADLRKLSPLTPDKQAGNQEA